MSAITNRGANAACSHHARYENMRDPEPKPDAQDEAVTSREPQTQAESRDGAIKAGDPAVVEAAEIADQVHANA